MKKIVVILVVMAGFLACKQNDNKSGSGKLTQEEKEKAGKDSANFTTIQWIDSVDKDLGKLKKGQSVEITYRFKNTGNKNLIIENVTAQCGCTIVERPDQAFAPGEEGLIKAKYNGSGSGVILKKIDVVANTKPAKEHSLSFTGEINE